MEEQILLGASNGMNFNGLISILSTYTQGFASVIGTGPTMNWSPPGYAEMLHPWRFNTYLEQIVGPGFAILLVIIAILVIRKLFRKISR